MKMLFTWLGFFLPSFLPLFGQVPQSIDFQIIPNKTCYDSPFLLTATATSKLPVSFKVELGKVNLSGNLLTITGPGSVIIIASQSGDAVFEPAPEVQQSFNVEIPYDLSLFPSTFTPKVNWCQGDNLLETMKTVAGISYKWTTPDLKTISGNQLSIPSVTSSNSGIYKLTLFEGNCTFTDITFQEIVHSKPAPKITSMPDTVYSNDPPFSVTATPTGGIFSGKNILSDSTYTPSKSTFGVDSIFYSVRSKFGCVGKTNKTIFIKTRIEAPIDSSIVVYELVTANNDSKNDYFAIENINKYPDHELSIFDRWGQRLFYSNKYDNKWDGAGLPEGGYYYVLKIKSPDKLFSGGFYLTR